MRPLPGRPFVALVTLVALLTNDLRAETSWKQLTSAASRAVRECLDSVDQPLTEDGRRRAVGNLEQVVDAILSADLEKPGRVERLGAVLNFAETLPPELFPDVHRWFGARVSKAIAALDASHVDLLCALAREFWAPRRRKDATKDEVGRMLLALELRPLLERHRGDPEAVGALAVLVTDIIQREVEWLEPISSRPMSLSAAVKALARNVETPTIYPVMDGADALHDIALESDSPTKMLAPIVSSFIAALKKIEVRVKGPGGKVLSADDQRAATQTRLWHRVLPTLQKWTGQARFVWSHEWEEFWGLYHGEDAAQPFDFREARDRFNGILDSGTAVFVRREEADLSERLRANFFEIGSTAAKILIILDTSTSMASPIEDDRQESRLEVFKREAVRFVAGLPAGVQFNILPFASNASIEKSLSKSHKLVPKMLPRGGLSGRVEAWILNLKAEGKTRTDLAFREAFNVRRDGNKKPKPGKFRPEFEEIYLITDGDPTDDKGKLIPREELDALLEEIRGMNTRFRVRIHTLGYPGHMTRFLHSLSLQNDGRMKTIRRVTSRRGAGEPR